MPRSKPSRSIRLLVLGTALMSAGALTACEAPSPGITIWSGAASVRADALCWAHDSQSLEPGACAEEILSGTDVGDVPELAVVSGNYFGISVDTAIAESGWTVRIGGQPLNTTPLTSTYFRFQLPQGLEVPAEGFTVQVVAGQSVPVRGIWATRLIAKA